MRPLPYDLFLERRADAIGRHVKLRHTWGWVAPLALALLAAAVVLFVPATRADAAGAAPITVPFDHLTTGFELDGVHRDLPCESCHLNAVFRGTPRDCGTCHIKGSLFNATPKTTTHIPSTNNCAACHNTISFRPDMHFSHAEVMGSCVSCHNGVIATGMTIPPHPRTNQNCAACHTVISWNPPSMVDHTQIPLAVAGFCIICHNGKDADGKNPGHIATSLECGDCHLTTTWLGANFDHTGIVSGCASCHNGTKAVGKQGNHMPTTNLCESCHTTGIGTKNPTRPVTAAPSKLPRVSSPGSRPITFPPLPGPAIVRSATATRRRRRPGPFSPAASQPCIKVWTRRTVCSATAGRASRGCPRHTFRCRCPAYRRPRKPRSRRRIFRF